MVSVVCAGGSRERTHSIWRCKDRGVFAAAQADKPFGEANARGNVVSEGEDNGEHVVEIGD